VYQLVRVRRHRPYVHAIIYEQRTIPPTCPISGIVRAPKIESTMEWYIASPSLEVVPSRQTGRGRGTRRKKGRAVK
jgi:hypothetical protein